MDTEILFSPKIIYFSYSIVRVYSDVDRKISRDGHRKKDWKIAKKTEKSTIKPLSAISVPCMKIHMGHAPPSADAHESICLYFKVIQEDVLELEFKLIKYAQKCTIL